MLAFPPTSAIYPAHPGNNPIQGGIAFRPPSFDINWFRRWPIIRSILLGSLMLISSEAIVGLDIANLAIEGSKSGGLALLGLDPSKVGAGLWSGSISFLAAIFILVTICVQNKRVAATFALIAVGLAFLFTIVLIGLTANTIQLRQNSNVAPNMVVTQYRLLIAILSIALFVLVLCIAFVIMYITTFLSTSTR